MIAAGPRRLGLLLLLGTTLAAMPARAATAAAPNQPLEPLEPLVQACDAAIRAGRRSDLQTVQRQLEGRHPAPAPPSELEADARALLACAAPTAASRVLQRHAPAPGPDRDRWWLLEWQAAALALQHEAAAAALLAYAGADTARLTTLKLSTASTADPGSRRAALDLLADHLEAAGRNQQAAEVLLAGQAAVGPDGADTDAVVLAERLRRVARLRSDLPEAERLRLLEQALEIAGAAAAWGLASELLAEQMALASPSARERLLRLSIRLDDAYGEWQLWRQDAPDAPRTRQLERQLRSPLDPNSHDPSSGTAPLPDR